MNIEIAKRLTELRKKNGYSQEALAAKLGISRQAVSKWERAEASPDTDNLITLSRLYGVSLDGLLKSGDETDKFSDKNEKETAARGNTVQESPEKENAAEKNPAESGGTEDKIKDEDNKKEVKKELLRVFSIGLIVTAAYLAIGFVYSRWHPGWLLFFLIPITDSIFDVIERKKVSEFSYTVFATLIFLCLGFFRGLWNTAWVVFLPIPVFHTLRRYCIRLTRRNGEYIYTKNKK